VDAPAISRCLSKIAAANRPRNIEHTGTAGNEETHMSRSVLIALFASATALFAAPLASNAENAKITAAAASEVPYSADVKTLKMPVMLVFGDSDMYRPEHIVKFYQLLGGGLKDAGWNRETMVQNRLAIIPNRTHHDVFFAPELVAAVLPFLNGETKVKSWAEQGRDQQ
jgi:pimeloyl-ACP methyl ester carboxylesterase